jgi:hypothetical protein
MVSNLLFYQLALIALVWLFLMLRRLWPRVEVHTLWACEYMPGYVGTRTRRAPGGLEGLSSEVMIRRRRFHGFC